MTTDYEHQLPPTYGGFTSPPSTDLAPPAAAPEPAGPPVFGRRKDAAKRVTFTLLTYDSRDTEQQHSLTARAAVDTASVFGFGRSGQSLGAQIAAIRNLLLRTLVDDDGIGVHQNVEQVAPHSETGDLVPVDEIPNDSWSMGDLGWRAPDGQTFDTAGEAAAHCREHGSSLRRFVAIMDDDSLSVEQSALEEILDYLMTEAADRPTSRSSASSRSRPRKGR